jgi:molybdate transport system regulatory protein
MTGAPVLDIKIRLYAGDEIAMGPGKADLLDAIDREGSISGAGRALDMSYRRAWLLVDTMNRCFARPVVETRPGSSKGGGAKITPFGAELLANYRALQQAAQDGVRGKALEDLLSAISPD